MSDGSVVFELFTYLVDQMATGKLNEEQTASLFSLVLFSWLDTTVTKASKVAHLPLDELPSLAISDSAKTLVADSFSVRVALIVWDSFK